MRPCVSLVLAALIMPSGIGCTHMHLHRSTVRQAGTLDDIYQQQVLDNLAKFVYDSNSLPHFAFPNQGGRRSTTRSAGSRSSTG